MSRVRWFSILSIALVGSACTADPQAARVRRLSPLQIDVIQKGETEPAFDNAYWNLHEPGIYVDVVSGEPLFSSIEKFDSGTGWPSFYAPLAPDNVVARPEGSPAGRMEVRSRRADTHLGHLFQDGPAPTGLRYCMNSAALRFIPAERLAADHYDEYVDRFPTVKQVNQPDDGERIEPAEGFAATNGHLSSAAARAAAQNRAGLTPDLEVAVLAGGCFWGMEEMMGQLPGVVSTQAGYAGGSAETARYEAVATGGTGHAESVRIAFDPKRVSYEGVLKWFFRIHDATALNRQGHDVGAQYRSAIFFQTPEQERIAYQIKTQLDRSGQLDVPSVTEINPAVPFYPAEASHQHYLQKNPGGYSCHYLRNIKL